MTEKDYCSTVCQAKCCRKHSGMKSPDACPMLTTDNLCSIYPNRLGFLFAGRNQQGQEFTCRCVSVEVFLPHLPPEIREQCCYHNPALLERP